MIVERRSEIRLAACATLLLSLAGALFFWPILVTGRVPVFRDILDSTVPFGQYIGERLRQGQLPQWFPFDGLGEPFIGQLNEGAFHPASWLYALLPLAPALRMELLLGYLGAATGQLLFARRLGLSWTAAALASVAFTFSGYVVSLNNVLPYLWGVAAIPWMGFCAAEACRRERPWPWVAGLALFWTTTLLAGDSHSWFLGGLVVLLAVAHTGRWGRLLHCVLAGLLALGLAAAELLPALDLVREGPRTGWEPTLRIASRFWALHPHRLPELFFPGWFHWRPAHFLALVGYSEHGMWATSIYTAAPVIALALVGLASRTRIGVLAGGLALLALWLATGIHGGLEPVVRRLPLLKLLRYPEKFLGLFAVSVALAAGAGLDWLRTRPRPAIAVALGTAAAASALVAFLLPKDFALRVWPVIKIMPDLIPQLHETWHGALLASALALAGTAAILVVARGRASLLALLPVLVFTDLWRANGGIIGTADPGFLSESPRFCSVARQEGAGPDGLRAVNVSARERRTEEMETPAIWAADSLNQLTPAESALCKIGSIWATSVLSNEPRWVRWAIGQNHLEKNAALPLYGFGLVVRATPTDSALKDETILDALPVNADETLLLVRRPAAPRAYAAIPRWVPDGVSALREVEAHGLELVESPVLAGSGRSYAGSGRAGDVRIITYEPEHVVLEARMTRPGAVVLNDLAVRGWTATVDGVPARIYRANVLARGVLVPEGNHRIEMKYEVPRLRTGLAVSSACLLLSAGLVLTGARRRPAKGEARASGSA